MECVGIKQNMGEFRVVLLKPTLSALAKRFIWQAHRELESFGRLEDAEHFAAQEADARGCRLYYANPEGVQCFGLDPLRLAVLRAKLLQEEGVQP